MNVASGVYDFQEIQYLHRKLVNGWECQFDLVFGAEVIRERLAK